MTLAAMTRRFHAGLRKTHDTLRFEVRQSEDALAAVLTKKEREIWEAAAKMGQFGFNELVKRSKITNRKAVSRALRKAENHGLVTRTEKRYVVVRLDA